MSNPLYPVSKNSVGKRIPIIPSINYDTKQYFMEGSECIEEVNVAGVLFDTAPLKPGMSCDVYALSNANQLINQGLIDVADTLSYDSRIKYVYVSIGGSIMKFDLHGVKNADAVASLHGDTRGMNYNLTTDRLRINKDSLDYLGQPFNYRHVLATFNTELTLSLFLSGRVDNSRGQCSFDKGNVYIESATSSGVDAVVNAKYITPLVQATIGDCYITGFELDLAIEPRNDDPATAS